jgi:pimeloyl-ACP methyl ester carboxylesterase
MLVDLRMHGESQGFEPPHTLDACAADLEALAEDTGLFPAAVLGHSFGGKVALSYLARAATSDEVPRQVWIMDATPSARDAVGDAARMLGAVRSLPARFSSRAAAVDALREAGFPDRVASWMSANLTRSEEGYGWKLDFDALELLLHDFFRLDMWPIVEDPPPGSELHFVKATRSLVMTEGEAERIRAIGRDRPVHLHEVEGGHWLNADNPDAVLALLESGRRPCSPGAVPAEELKDLEPSSGAANRSACQSRRGAGDCTTVESDLHLAGEVGSTRHEATTGVQANGDRARHVEPARNGQRAGDEDQSTPSKLARDREVTADDESAPAGHGSGEGKSGG